VTVLCAGQSGVRIAGRAQGILTVVHITQTDCGAHLPFYSVSAGVHFRRVRRPGRQVEQVLPSRAEVKNEGTYTSIPPVCFRGMDMGTFTFTITATLLVLPYERNIVH
jgi:hypothetical protein